MGSDPTPLVILGSAAAGLCVLRRTANSRKDVHLIGRAGEIGQRSKWGTKHPLTDTRELEGLLERVRESFGRSRGKAILTSDYFITAMIERSSSAFGWFDWIGPSEAILRKFNDKVQFYTHASSRGVSVPSTLPLSGWTTDRSQDHPWIVKWAETDLVADLGQAHRKTWLCPNAAAVSKLKDSLPSDSLGKLMVQRFLSDDDYDQLSYGAFFQGGVEVASIVVRQHRQRPRGVSSFVEEISGNAADDVRESALSLVKDEGYEGFLEVEVRRRRTGGELLLLDVNPRPWGWVQALFAKYPGLPLAFSGGDVGKPRDDLIRWGNPARDLPAIASQCLASRSMRPMTGALQYASRSTSIDLLDLSDPMPLIGGAMLVAKRAFRSWGGA